MAPMAGPVDTLRAPFASDPKKSRGRLVFEAPPANRSAFQRDRDRIIHSGAFRRLKHKTQVFVAHEGDHYRTRLTHSIEVAQIARSISRTLGLDEDLAEALALAHDLGHTPFGHAGEEALHKAAAPFGGFDHNAQTLKIVTKLERRYAAFDGLNLTFETLEGLVKHNGPCLRPDLPIAIQDYVAQHDLELGTWPGPEAQVAALSDDIAYNNHDIDDGLRADLFTIDDLYAVPWVGQAFESVAEAYPGLERPRLIHEAIRRLIDSMVADLLAETRRRLAEIKPQSVDDVRLAGRALVAFSDEMAANDRALKEFLYRRMYRHYKVNRMMSKAKRVVDDLFRLFLAEPSLLPPEWARDCDGPGNPRTARRAADYIAGMTDGYALSEHVRLFDVSQNER
jgi:dGTPase